MNARQARVLHLVAEAYIDTAHPVPSGVIAERLDVSSATVRNDFGSLESDGFLQQPHTSAGRIPTALGFRTYALAHLPPPRLPPRLRRDVRRRLAGTDGDDLFELASRLAAELSGYAVVVRLPPDEALRILEIHLSLRTARRLLAVVVLDNGLVRQIGVELDPAPEESVIDDAERNLRQLTLPVGEVPRALRALARHAVPELARTLRAVADAWRGLQPPRIFRDGLGRVLREPEGSDPGFVRTVVEQVEHEPLHPAHGASRATARGEDTADVDDLELTLDDTVARVSATFGCGSGRGRLTLVGPARMRYPRALTIARELGDALERGRSPGAADDAA